MVGESLSGELRAVLESNGANMVGFADLQNLASDVRDGFPCGISIAVALNPRIISGLVNGPNKQYFTEYERVNNLLDSLGQCTFKFLEGQGYKAKWFPATNIGIDPETLSTRLPHKTVATRAGMGWIGKNALLVTNDFGSAVRITSVLTDAILPAGNPVNASRCGECHACVDICPGHAISGKEWQVNVHRDSLYDAFKCRRTAQEWALKRKGIRDNICGMCIAVCPWTQKYTEKS